MTVKKTSKRKEIEDGDLWLYDEDVNDVIKKFARAQDDSKYYYG